MKGAETRTDSISNLTDLSYNLSDEAGGYLCRRLPPPYNQSAPRNITRGRSSSSHKRMSHAIPTIGQQRSANLGSLARHHDIWRRLGLGHRERRIPQGL